MQITSIGSGDGGKNSDAVYYFIFWGSFYLIFLNKRTFIASCRDLSPNRPFQELSVYYSIHQTSEILRSSILGWNLGVQNVITYHRTPDYICYNFFLIFFRIQKQKKSSQLCSKRLSVRKKDSFWFVKYSVWWQKCYQILHKTWIEMWKVWQNENFIWKSRSETCFIE